MVCKLYLNKKHNKWDVCDAYFQRIHLEYIRNTCKSIWKRQPKRKVETDLNRHLTKGDIRMANKHVNRYSPLLVIKEMRIKATTLCRHRRWRRKHQMLVRIWSTQTHTASRGYKSGEPLRKIGRLYYLKHTCLLWPGNSPPKYIPNINTCNCSTEVMGKNAQNSTIHNCPNVEKTHRFYIQCGIVTQWNTTQKWSTTTWTNLTNTLNESSQTQRLKTQLCVTSKNKKTSSMTSEVMIAISWLGVEDSF